MLDKKYAYTLATQDGVVLASRRTFNEMCNDLFDGEDDLHELEIEKRAKEERQRQLNRAIVRIDYISPVRLRRSRHRSRVA